MESTTEKYSGQRTQISLKRKEIFELIKDNINKNNAVLFKLIEEHLLKINKQTFSLCVEVKYDLTKLFYKLRQKLQESNRKYEKFFAKNESWLAVDVNLCDKPNNVWDSEESSSSFQDSSERTKRRRTQNISEQPNVEELAYVTQMKFRASGNLDAARVVQEISTESPTKATRYITSLNNLRGKQMTQDEALLLVIENKISKSTYNNIRASSIRHNCNLYPPYKYVLQAKKDCYPSAADITITDCSAEVKLQSLLDHTVQRILLVQKDVIKNLTADNVRNVNLICKWGSSSQSSCKQKFDDDVDGKKTDASIFFISLLPLQIISADKSTNNEIIIWKNPRPLSPRFCRPIKIEFLHETAESTRLKVDNIKQQERHLIPLQTIVDGKEINVRYQLALTMIDGKVCNSLTGTPSSQRCYLCHCTSKEFNNIDEMLRKEIKKDHLEFGISSLHAWICLFECLLHISYKLDVKKWQNRTEDKPSIETRKKNIQKGFRQQLGLLVDQPKQGYGSTNDGYTARRFFQNSLISASITGIDETLIKRFHVILQVISCGFKINISKFEEYCVVTARLFVQLYPWFYMPTTVHKLLIHSAEIIETSLLPIGQMPEETQKSSKKFIKIYRQDFARKSSHIKSMEDVFSRLLISSDPFISSIQKLPTKHLKSLESEAIELLDTHVCHDSNVSFSQIQSSSEDESEYSSDDEY